MSVITQKNRDELETKGYTVVKSVLSEEECQAHIQEYVNWIENNFDEGDFPYSWNSLIQGYSIGHLAPSWSVRLKCKPVFAELWGTKELLSSMDAVAIGRPPEQGQEDFHTQDKSWLHIDQGPGRLGVHAYQGGLHLETANMDDWVFECMDGSHELFERFYKEHPKCREATLHNANDTLVLSEAHIRWYREKGCLRRRVAVPKGGLLLWDSRLIHNNVRPIKGRVNTERWRFVVFVCMGPALWADKASLKAKKRAYRDLRMTTHWPCNGVHLFPNRLSDKALAAKYPLKELPKVATTLEAMQLAGVTSYNKLKKKSEQRLAEERSIHKPLFSPDYKPHTEPSSSGVGWVVVAVVSTIVCAVSIYVYVYVMNKSK